MIYDDFYCEPSESDLAIQKLKEHLKNEVKSEIINELEHLKKENAELQDIKKNKSKLENEYKEKIRQLELEYKEKERTLYKRPLQELVEIIQEEYYYVCQENLEKEKCDKCNENRQLELIDCYGRKHYVDCICKGTYKSKFIVKEKYIGNIPEISKKDNKLHMWLDFRYEKSCNKEDYYASSTHFDKGDLIYNFDDLINKNEEDILDRLKKGFYFSCYTFSKKEEAQKLADYLNKEIEKLESKDE